MVIATRSRTVIIVIVVIVVVMVVQTRILAVPPQHGVGFFFHDPSSDHWDSIHQPTTFPILLHHPARSFLLDAFLFFFFFFRTEVTVVVVVVVVPTRTAWRGWMRRPHVPQWWW